MRKLNTALFRASWIRINNCVYGSGYFHPFHSFVTFLNLLPMSLRLIKNAPTVSYQQKSFEKCFFGLLSCKLLEKRAESESGFVSKRQIRNACDSSSRNT
jgi:hypothetical protein